MESNTEKKDFKGVQNFQNRKGKNTQSNFMEHSKVPPQAVDLEVVVLGAMMLEEQAINKAIDILRPEMFYKEAHNKIFDAIKGLFGKSEPVDILTVTNELKLRGELEVVGGAYYISLLTNRVTSGANVEFHARIVSQKFIQRELIRISSDIIHDAFEDTTDVFDLLDKAETNLFEVAENNLRRSAENMTSLVKSAVDNIEKAAQNEGSMSGIPSGFHKLDNVTAGWQPTDLIILAARPGMGKTAFVLSMARNIAVDFGKAIAIFSLEMGAVQLVTRLMSSEAEIPSEKLKKGTLDKADWDKLNKSIGNLTRANILIDDTPGLSIFELRAKSRRLKAQHDIQMIIIDYLQLMTADAGGKGGNREQEISTISRSLKALAKELNVPVICLSQLNRSVETRGGSKKPQLSDLRESGAIEQDADMVCFIYRPEYYGIEPEDGSDPTGLAQIIIAKHRNGSLEDINLTFEGQFVKFVNRIESNMDFTEASEILNNISPNASFDSDSGVVSVPSKMNQDLDDDPDMPGLSMGGDVPPFMQ